ncbi:hypothetical protein BMS3Bbin04_01652 [bacterium BMS3Bbin04]|nr:hypothetical protein BMS3Bbin04_01652 [bacterium BMS3Bbin04]
MFHQVGVANDVGDFQLAGGFDLVHQTHGAIHSVGERSVFIQHEVHLVATCFERWHQRGQHSRAHVISADIEKGETVRIRHRSTYFRQQNRQVGVVHVRFRRYDSDAQFFHRFTCFPATEIGIHQIEIGDGDLVAAVTCQSCRDID